jgi:hypothetical protein
MTLWTFETGKSLATIMELQSSSTGVCVRFSNHAGSKLELGRSLCSPLRIMLMFVDANVRWGESPTERTHPP